MEELAIGAVAQQLGIRTSALRYYESIGLLPPPRRVNGRRRYTPDVVKAVRVIRLAQQAGFSMAEIHTLFNSFAADTPAAARWHALATEKLAEVETLIGRAQQMKEILEMLLRCGCLRLEECVLDGELSCADGQALSPAECIV
jgi:MerR family redox-sensitive transcriptional activator SoxR